MKSDHNRTTSAFRARRPSRRQALQLLTAGAAGLTLSSRRVLAQNAQGSSTPKPFDPALLDRAVEIAGKFDQIHSLTIARAGEIAFAEAFRGPALDRPVNVKSVSKSFVAALTGAAIERGVLDGIDQQLADAAPALVPANADPKVRDLTIAQFLTMQAGLKRTSGPNYGEWVKSRNWVAYALSQPFVAEPGQRMLYSTGSYHILGAILAKASGNSLLTLAREWIGEDLDIAIPPWARDPQGFYFGGNNMRLSPMAMLRFGEMHRQGGLWNGRQILSKDWIEKAWEPRTRSPFSGDAYGYGWFISQAAGKKFVYARGYGGQMIYIVPELELTVAITSDPGRPARSQGYAGQLRDLLTQQIMPAAV